MRWSNTIIVVAVIVTLGTLTLLGKISGTEVIPMLTAVMTYSLGFHVVTVSGENNGNGHDKSEEKKE